MPAYNRTLKAADEQKVEYIYTFYTVASCDNDRIELRKKILF